MSDDCANNWGCYLGLFRSKDLRQFSSASGENVLAGLKSTVSIDLGHEYVLTRVLSCGSDANMFSVVQLTEGNTTSCLIAAGSYVAGDGGPLQSWSTSTFSIHGGPSGISPPTSVKNEFTRSHTIALPYAIDGSLEPNIIEAYENECLKELHVRCMLAKMRGSAYKCILMELMLSSNGASLSNRALIMLGKLAEKHNLNFVVDEIMTGGRCGTMLMLQKKPTVFTNRVTHVTMGKWLQVGFVLESSNYYNQKERIPEHIISSRGASTFIDCRQVLLYWKEVQANLHVTEIRREMIIKKLKLAKEEVWGEGCLIFAPIKRTGTVLGTKNRFLPMLSIYTHIDKFNCTKMREWSKENINLDIMIGVKTWLNFRPYYAGENNDNYRKLMTYLLTWNQHDFKKTEDVKAAIFPNLSIANVSAILRTAETAGLLTYVVRGSKRLRFLNVTVISECIEEFNLTK